jgi:hypothetical protein
VENARLSLSLTLYLAITRPKFSPAVLLFDLIGIRTGSITVSLFCHCLTSRVTQAAVLA